MSDDLRYPIGKYRHEGDVTDPDLIEWIEQMEELPAQMRGAVAALDDEQLDTRYRPGGWTIRQVVHHVPDSHLNGYVRFKWTLTEDEPLIKAYHEDRWAELPDTPVVPVEASLDLLTALQAKWIMLIRSLSREQLGRRFKHPETGTMMELAWMVGLYAWHGRHHLAHIQSTVTREGW
ncbi:MAG TPA: putative metal-dependent hydrolase [Longimicrobiales bacterium]|nr:putative metal-dependent hydrolase [Longimicrobiales bacterium]